MSRPLKSIILLAAVLLGGVVLGIAGFFAYREWIQPSEETPAATPEVTAVPVPTPTPLPTPTPEPTPPPYVPPEDLAEYQSVNPDVIAVIDIPGTAVHYPVLLHPTEDNYYLNITIDGYSGYPGSIYTNSMEGKNFDTFNTVIYGHNMYDGTMFGTLKNYQDRSFMEANREIHIYTPTEEIVYTIVANVIYDDRYVTYYYDDNNMEQRKLYLQSLHNGYNGTYWLDDVEVTTDRHILTLQTCIDGMPDNRRFIIAVRQESAENPTPIKPAPASVSGVYTSPVKTALADAIQPDSTIHEESVSGPIVIR
ncbi:MAG: class B sortase [Oscillospiraceae bacterium]|nr:class B sortase [Oscillospiraceae bacterium]